MSSSSSSSSSIFLPPSQTRLVTIIAHVDHGKTTLADNLIESNGIISERLAGTLRYLDFTEEEQRRGITMRTSAIGLKHSYATAPAQAGANKNNNKNKSSSLGSSSDMIIHLLDSPGHTDFAPEVSSSLQCCDAALLVVDAVEGMCARTHQVLREAHLHELVPILVINKVDRLCTELCLTPTEAYLRLRGLLETVNAAAAAMIVHNNSFILERDGPVHDASSNGKATATTTTTTTATTKTTTTSSSSSTTTTQTTDDDDAPTEEEQRWTFEPSKGNVVFASALFGWGFTVPALARSLFRSHQIQIKPVLLKQYLFGDFKYKDGKVLKWKSQQDESSPMFAVYGLEPIWNIYQGVATAALALGQGSTLFADMRLPAISATANSTAANNNNNSNKDNKIKSDTPGMEVVLQELQSGGTKAMVASKTSSPSNVMTIPTSSPELQQVLNKTGSSTEETILRCLLRRYRSLSDAVLDAVCEHGPSPRVASQSLRTRALALRPPPSPSVVTDDAADDGKDTALFAKIQQSVTNCDTSPDAPTVAFVCKFMATDRANVRDMQLPTEPTNLIMGVARVLSGKLCTNQPYFCMGPKHRGEGNQQSTAQQRVVRLYLLMGSSLLKVDQVPAGHLCAIYGLEDLQFKTVTLCDSIHGMPLQGYHLGLRPLVKVNVEPVHSQDMETLERGLVQLSLADTAVEVTATAKGERILACLGELHLEQSILDLQKIYCANEIALRISDPIVEFGETTDWFHHDDRHSETADFAAFFDHSLTLPPLRQTVIPPYNEEEGIDFAARGRARAILSGRLAAIGVRVVPLATTVYQSLQQKKRIDASDEEFLQLGQALGCRESTPEGVFQLLLETLCALDKCGNAILESKGMNDGSCVKGVVSNNGEIYLPPKHNADESASSQSCGLPEYQSARQAIRTGGLSGADSSDLPSAADKAAMTIWKSKMKGSIAAGFQVAMRSGPICEEQVRRVLVVVESVEIAVKAEHEDENGETTFTNAKPLNGGMVVAALRSGIRCALLSRPARLMEGHLLLTLHTSLAGLGALYAVLSKRRGKVLEDSVVDGTDLLLITAILPQAESFGLSPELLRKSSGEVSVPELVFSHWERLEEDPFWIPTSLEEREDFGEILQNGDASTGLDNTALNYIRKVRERKGLLVDSSRTVVAAEKQRTLKR